MATATINTQLVFRIETVAGENSVTFTVPRGCTFQFASTWGTGTTDCGIALTRIRTGVPNETLFQDFVLDGGLAGVTSTKFSNKELYFGVADLLKGDQLLVTKTDALAAGSIFIYVMAPGAVLQSTAVV